MELRKLFISNRLSFACGCLSRWALGPNHLAHKCLPPGGSRREKIIQTGAPHSMPETYF